MKAFGIVLDFKAKTIPFHEIILPIRNINLLQGASTLRMLKLNNSLAMELKSTQNATKHVTCILDVKLQQSKYPVNPQGQLQASKCQISDKITAASQELWVALQQHLR
jgi:hypothetical protein